MRNIEFFTTENGIASLILKEIPYQKAAYVRIQCASDLFALIEECVQLCVAAGAEAVYGTGHELLSSYPHYTDVLKMTAQPAQGPVSDACLFPATPETIGKWREIYNNKMRNVPNSAFCSIQDGEKLLNDHAAYFVHWNGELLGIGSVGEDSIGAVASVRAGAGERVVRALCSAVDSETVSLEVASVNRKAVELYKRIGFEAVSCVSSWYTLYKSHRS